MNFDRWNRQLIYVRMALLSYLDDKRPPLVASKSVKDCFSTRQYIVDEFRELVGVNLVDGDLATLQFLHQIPMQVGEAEIRHELPSIIIQGIVNGEQ